MNKRELIINKVIFSILLLLFYKLLGCFGGIDPTQSRQLVIEETTTMMNTTTTTTTMMNTTTTTTTTTTCEAPRSDNWYRCFSEYSDAPIIDEGKRQYYPSVLYDSNAFGNNVGDYINGSSGGTYQVKPYYKMYVGQYTTFFSTEFLYSNDGINWIHPTEGVNLMSGSYHPMVMYKSDNFEDGHKYKMWNWNPDKNDLEYYYSDDGYNFTNYVPGNVNNSKFWGFGIMYFCYVLRRGTNDYRGWFGNEGKIYYATSTDAISWNTGTVCINSVSSSEIYSSGGNLSVYINNNKYCIWFSTLADGTLDVSPNGNRGISYAESTDGINWVMVDNIPGMGSIKNAVLNINDGNTWRTAYTYTPWVVYSPTKFDGHGLLRDFKMWFTGGSSSSSRRIGFVSFNNP